MDMYSMCGEEESDPGHNKPNGLTEKIEDAPEEVDIDAIESMLDASLVSIDKFVFADRTMHFNDCRLSECTGIEHTVWHRAIHANVARARDERDEDEKRCCMPLLHLNLYCISW